MKTILVTALLSTGLLPVSAAVIYHDLGGLTIPNDLDGLYINVVTGATATSEPLGFGTAPWINLFLGGSQISNSEQMRPWASSASYDIDQDYFVNLAPGTVIDSAGLFVSGETGSYLHVGAGADQFQTGVQGYLGFAYDLPLGGGVAYGWLRMTVNDSGAGTVFDFARSDLAGEAILVGAIPEPSAFAALAGVIGLGVVALRRRRPA